MEGLTADWSKGRSAFIEEMQVEHTDADTGGFGYVEVDVHGHLLLITSTFSEARSPAGSPYGEGVGGLMRKEKVLT